MIAPVRVLGHGLACPVGLTTNTALAAMHAGVKRIIESERVRDSRGDFARASMLTQLDQDTPRTKRALHMARFAIAHACAPLSSGGVPPVPCFLALPSPAFGQPLDLVLICRHLSEVVRDRVGVELAFDQRRMFTQGRAAAFLALREAMAALTRGECAVALVGGLDSQVDPTTLGVLADNIRILCASNPDGLIPGEGAAFLLLGNEHAASMHQVGRVTSCAIASEPHPRGLGGPNIGLGLTSLFGELRKSRNRRFDAVISAQTGESTFERALAYAYLRNAAWMPEPMRLTVMGTLVGDAGAAAGAMALVAGVAGLQPPRALAGRTPGHTSVLVYGESDDGPVGGCIVEC
ncbi:MAG: beta-ketoacyl synthase N-terminal-like domain-containing protein [Enhygromyxa sp.]